MEVAAAAATAVVLLLAADVDEEGDVFLALVMLLGHRFPWPLLLLLLLKWWAANFPASSPGEASFLPLLPTGPGGGNLCTDRPKENESISARWVRIFHKKGS